MYKIFLIFKYLWNYASIYAQNSVKILVNPYTWRLPVLLCVMYIFPHPPAAPSNQQFIKYHHFLSSGIQLNIAQMGDVAQAYTTLYILRFSGRGSWILCVVDRSQTFNVKIVGVATQKIGVVENFDHAHTLCVLCPFVPTLISFKAANYILC